MSKKVEATSVSDDIYLKGKLPISKLITIFFIVLMTTVLFNLSISDKLVATAEKGINSLRACPIAHNGVEFSWFLPKLIIKSPELPPKCFGKKDGQSVNFQTIPISLSIPSIYPPGIKLHTQLKTKNSSSIINIYPTLSLSKNLVRITDTTIGHDLVNEMIGSEVIKGNFTVETSLELIKSTPSSGDLLIKSSNLKIAKQNISGLTIPELSLNNFQFKGNLLKSKIKIVSFIVGDESSPIVANISGSIRLNKYNIQKSKLNLTGEVKFSQELLTAFPIINLATAGKKNQGGFYKIKITGQLNSPTPQIQ